jgi:hypothetical protein
MKKRSTKKLQLGKTTLQHLSNHAQSRLQGGGSNPCVATKTCPPSVVICPTGLCITYVNCGTDI